ncbi:GNAT family N-acetyltransferase [Sunxiuqinia indica]|uniref:GNAT family N-acetyltransferase n=1 Tax=Sunxiuqinia indica TaxID=2692584 RepID=UPI00135993B3|nr:GNAT family N-acetyltransferase [Sunxiuqinia indica]
MEAKFRKIKKTDFPKLIELFKEFATFQRMPGKVTNTEKQMLQESDYVNGFVACQGREVIGYVTCFFAYYTWIGKSLYMDDLYVKPQFRGQGVGTKLINQVIEFGQAQNCKKLHWQVSEWNQPAIDFYKSIGASVDGVESNCDLPL